MSTPRTHDTAPASVPAAEIRVRAMADADCEAVAGIRIRGWRTAYAGLMPASFLAELSIEEDAARRRERLAQAGSSVVNVVAEHAGDIVGWACHGPSRDDDLPPGEAELYAIYVHDGRLSTGVGRTLLHSCLERCAESGYERIRLWVLKGNTRARAFYERAGFTPDGAEEPYEAGGELVPEVRYVRAVSP
ncbi:GNAT family N-acetyltransferase [Streptomyces sp. NBC_00569]|uniref:GNAT family N-acetyltransferase n=1 Tax=Streptomyces sp. NBC_00569 TaxID=2975780 RepID=UPI002E806554|nr:GNAT family N-acetyltransferase [Streptomyces sp. NBC_00569]WUB92992.1 GNAT family N-acetyltransferase [Streptomyces sp. NBC_00569]